MSSKFSLLFLICAVTCTSGMRGVRTKLENLIISSGAKNATKLIIDTDAGGGDAVAILLALLVPEKVQVVAITCTYGITDLINVENNVLKTLTIAGRTDIPVYSGAAKPLVRAYTAIDFYGKDGFGDFKFPIEVRGSIDRSKHAALAMVDLVKRHPGEISILTLGPTTNAALAMSIDPTFSQNVKRFYVVGSKLRDPDVAVEYNFSLDPESNAILLDSITQKPKLIISGDIGTDYLIPKEWRTDVFGQLKNEGVWLLNNAESKAMNHGWLALHSISMAMIIWPELITRSSEGRLIADLDNKNIPSTVKLVFDGKNYVTIAQEFNVEGFKAKLLQLFATWPPSPPRLPQIIINYLLAHFNKGA